MEVRDALRQGLALAVQNGGRQFDPARLEYIEALARKAIGKPEAVRRRIEEKACQALTDYQKCFEQARCEAKDIMARAASEHPDAAERMQKLFNESNFSGLRQLVQKLERASRKTITAARFHQMTRHRREWDQEKTALHFDDLLQRQEDEILEALGASTAGADASPTREQTELKNFRLLKQTWSKLHSDRLVTRAVKERPENAGPLNSQMLVTRALFTMRNLSPGYLNRFLSFMDTLFFLEQAAGEIKPRSDKKRNR